MHINFYGETSNHCSHLKNAHRSLWPASDKDESTERTTVNTKCINTYVGSIQVTFVCSFFSAFTHFYMSVNKESIR